MREDASKPSGFWAFFSRRKSRKAEAKKESDAKNAAPDTSPSSTAEDATRSGSISSTASRRKYVPRYAARDMILSMPVDQRPDVVAKAREAQRQNVCSEIGFTPSSSSIRSGSSQSQFSPPLSIHPNLQVSQQAHMDRLMYSRSRTPSLRSTRSGMSPRSVSTPTPLQQMQSISDLDGVETGSSQHRPPARSSVTETAVAGRSQSEQSLADLVIPEDDQISMGSEVTRPSTPGGIPSSAALAPRPPRQYFGHKQSLPNLRSNGGGKGKGRAYGLARHVSSDVDNAEATSTSSYEARDYVIRTEPRQMHGKVAAGLAAPACNFTPSRESSVTDSTDSRFISNTSTINGSTRAGSVTTVITEHTEHEAEHNEITAAGLNKSEERAEESADSQTIEVSEDSQAIKEPAEPERSSFEDMVQKILG